MRGKITVIGAGDAIASALEQADATDLVRLTASSELELSGSDVVVVAGGADVAAAARDAARRAPGAVLVIATDEPGRDTAMALEVSLLPRTRVFGVDAADAAAAASAVLFARDAPLRAWAFCRGELGISDRVAAVDVLLGAGGLRRIGDGSRGEPNPAPVA